MKKEEFDTVIQKAYGEGTGEGGLYFKENYEEAIQGEKTLQTIASDLKSDMKIEMDDSDKYGLTYDYMQRLETLMKMRTESDNECLQFLSEYVDYCRPSYPELCGSIVGAMYKKEMFEEAVKLIELDQVDDDVLYWDS